MRTREIGALGLAMAMAACWTGNGKQPAPPSNEAPRGPAELVFAAEPIVAAADDHDPQLARQMAIEQARAAGILGTAKARPEPDLPGPLDRASIQRTVREDLISIRLCYAERLSEDAKLEGTTTVAFAIGPDGSVAEAAGAGFDPEINRCAARAIKRLRFPTPAGGDTVRVRYPFRFQQAR